VPPAREDDALLGSPGLVSDPSGWNFVGPTGSTTAMMIMSGSDICVTGLKVNEYGNLGWGRTGTSLALTMGSSYTFSYRAYTTLSAVTVDAKVGEVAGAGTDYESPMNAVGTTAQTISHTFTAAGADPAAGFNFSFETTSTGQLFCVASANIASP
jgi:hypothetical protein